MFDKVITNHSASRRTSTCRVVVGRYVHLLWCCSGTLCAVGGSRGVAERVVHTYQRLTGQLAGWLYIWIWSTIIYTCRLRVTADRHK